MAAIYPRYAASAEELQLALDEERTVIIMTDPNLFPGIKRRVKKDRHAAAVTKLLAGASGLGVGGLMLGAAAFLPGVVIAGTAALVVGRIKGTIDQSIHKLSAYRYTEYPMDHMLILVKRKGRNAFRNGIDVIENDKCKADTFVKNF